MLKLDHVVYFTTESPDQTVTAQKQLGYHAVIGGHHLNWGTQNALLYTKNAYVEWLSVEDKNIAQSAHHPLTSLLLHDLKSGDGWGTICISVDDIKKFDSDIKRKGFNSSGIIEGSRKTPEGKIKKWKMLFIDQPDLNQLPYPFFIEWEERENIRFENLKNSKAILAENERLQIRECLFSVNDISQKINLWAKVLSLQVLETNSIRLPNAVLKFLPKSLNGKERLCEVIIK